MLSRDHLLHWHLEPARDLLELTHALGVLGRVLGVVREVAREQDQVWRLWQPVHDLDGALEGTVARWVGWPAEADMGVAQLDEGERDHALAVLAREQPLDVVRLPDAKAGATRYSAPKPGDAPAISRNFLRSNGLFIVWLRRRRVRRQRWEGKLWHVQRIVTHRHLRFVRCLRMALRVHLV